MQKFILISVAAMAMLSLFVCSRTQSIISNCSPTPNLNLFQIYETKFLFNSIDADTEAREGISPPLTCIGLCGNDSDAENEKCIESCSFKGFEQGRCIPNPTNVICCCNP